MKKIFSLLLTLAILTGVLFAISVTASAATDTHTVTWKVSGQEVHSETLSYGAAIVVPTVTVPANYHGVQWKTTIPSTMGDEDLVIEGVWTVKLTFIDENDNDVEVGPGGVNRDRPYNSVCPVGEEIYANYMETYGGRYGYDFWLVNIHDPSERYLLTYYAGMPQWPNITMDQNKTFRGTFIGREYTITFDTKGGSSVSPITQTFGSAVTAPADPTKEGHTFLGWDAEIPTTMPDENLTITASWKVNSYTVTYVADGKTVDTQTVEYGKDATAPAVPAKEGHSAAWDKDGKNITGDTTITAVYTPVKYTVTYVADGKTVDTQTVEHGKDAVAPTIPAKEGYTAAWDVDGKNIQADTTITAVYTKNSGSGDPGTQTPTDPPAATPKPADPTNPKTGDMTNVELYLALLLLSLAAMPFVIVGFRKRSYHI